MFNLQLLLGWPFPSHQKGAHFEYTGTRKQIFVWYDLVLTVNVFPPDYIKVHTHTT